MKKTRENSRIEVWDSDYINEPDERNREDRHAVIVQMEPGASGCSYMVEVVDYD